MERRGFMIGCAGAAMTASLPVFAAGEARPKLYGRALLVDERGEAIRTKSLPVQRNLIFHYPYAGTPCFLLNLGAPTKAGASLRTADQRRYEWSGGTGAGGGVVAYSAICSHKLTHPARDISFISYRGELTPGNKLARVIHCCSEHSQYDPAEGGRVLAGPAPQPLAAILLEHDAATDRLHAVGTLGGEMFNDFFAKFEFRLAIEHGGKAKNAVEGTCVVKELSDYCRQQVKC